MVCKRIKINNLEIKILNIDSIDRIEVENQLRNVTGLFFKKIKWFDDSSIHINDAVYGTYKYLSEEQLNKIRDQIILKLSRLHTLKSYKDIILSSKLLGNFHSKNYYLFVGDTIKKGIDVLIKNCLFEDKYFLSKRGFEVLSLEIKKNLDDISGIEFANIEVLNTMANNNNFIISLKDITYFGDKIHANNSLKFKNEIVNILDSINGFNADYVEVEFNFIN